MLEKRIKEVMYDHRITQGDLALILGVSQPVVSHMLRKGMSLKRFEDVCDALGCEVILKKGDTEYGTFKCDFGKY